MPKMARAAEGKANAIVVTVEHPGFNDPKKVIQHVLNGFSILQNRYTRREGVIKALEQSEPNDIVLLTSGCMNGCQIVEGEYIPHSDEGIIRKFFIGTQLLQTLEVGDEDSIYVTQI